MKATLFSHFSFAKLCVLGNALFWLIFALYFTVKSFPYKPHQPAFEEELAGYTYFGRAFPVENEYMGPFMRVTRFVQWPSFFAARPFFWYFNSRGIVVDHLYWGISVGGYYLILVCLLSFLQWYLIGLSCDWIKRRRVGRGAPPFVL